jgi:hypothetical protein
MREVYFRTEALAGVAEKTEKNSVTCCIAQGHLKSRKKNADLYCFFFSCHD